MGILIEPTLQGITWSPDTINVNCLMHSPDIINVNFRPAYHTSKFSGNGHYNHHLILPDQIWGIWHWCWPLNFLIHFSPLCSGTLWFGSQPTTCTPFFHLCCKVLAFSEVSSLTLFFGDHTLFLVFLPLSQELEKFLLEDQIVNILAVDSTVSVTTTLNCYSLKTCKWMGMTLLRQQNFHVQTKLCTRQHSQENGPECFNSSSK